MLKFLQSFDIKKCQWHAIAGSVLWERCVCEKGKYIEENRQLHGEGGSCGGASYLYVSLECAHIDIFGIPFCLDSIVNMIGATSKISLKALDHILKTDF